MAELPDTDLKNAFIAGRTRETDASGAAWQQLLSQGGYGPPTAQAPTAQPAAAAPQTQPNPAEGWQRGAIPIPPPNAAIASKIGHMLWSGASDIGSGLVHGPSQVIGGALDFTNNLFKLADDIVKKGEEHGLPNAYFELMDKEGKWNPRVMSTEEFRQAQQEGRDGVFQVPTTGKPDTVTGNVVRTGTTFVLGRGRLAAGGGVGANLLADFASGAQMDPSQARLSNVIDQVAPNFVTDFLKAKPDDEDKLFGRLKSGLEYAGLGAAFEGVKRSVGALKEALGGDEAATHPLLQPKAQGEGAAPVASTPGQAAEPAPQSVHASGEAPQGAPGLGGIDTLTDENFAKPGQALTAEQAVTGRAPAPVVTEADRQQAMSFFRGETGQSPVNTDLRSLRTLDDLQGMAERFKSFVPKEGPITLDDTRRAAELRGLSLDDFMAGYKGSALNSEEIVAAGNAWQASVKSFEPYVKLYNDPAATAAQKEEAVLAFGKLRAIDQYFSGAESEAGRTLNALKVVKGDIASKYGEQFRQLLQQPGDTRDAVDQVFAKAGEILENRPEKLTPFMSMLNRMSGRDAIVYGAQNMLLSPRTIGRKAATDVVMPLWNLANRYFAEKFGSGAVPDGETAQLAYGYVASVKDAVKLAGQAIKTGRSNFMQSMEGAPDMEEVTRLWNQVPGQISEEAPKKSAMEYLKYAMPTTYVGAVDDAASFTHYRGQLQALAFRRAMQSGLENGSDEFATSMASDLATPPSWMHEQAKAFSRTSTFKDDLTGFAAKAKDLIDGANWNLPVPHSDGLQIPVGRIIVPFVKIPFNLTAFTFRNTPVGLTYAGSRISQEMAAGGATRDLAIAKMTLGSAMMMAFTGLALDNVITGGGPRDPQLRRAWQDGGGPNGTKAQPYSWYIGGTGYSLMPEPFSGMASMAADTINVGRFAKDRDWEQAAFSAAFGFGHAMMSRTYFEGFANVFDAIDNPDRNSKAYLERLASSFLVPSVVRSGAEGMDQYYRMHYNLLEQLENASGIGRQNHPALQTFWGDPIPLKQGYMPLMSGTSLANLVSPVRFDPSPQANPIDRWIWENRQFFSPDEDPNSGRMGLPGIGYHVTFSQGPHVSSSITLSNEALFRYRELAGNVVKLPSTGMGAKDTLNNLVEGTLASPLQRTWDAASPEKQAIMVQSIVREARGMARAQLLKEFDDVKAAVNANWKTRAQQITAPAAAPQMAQ